ncbi:MAG: class II aldolase and adducin N-terminal domain-containing protein [Epsilonproteobacteria bacterium]|nr:class II aldolase and adducin N-terminal domain-containing protein [Campylobacterota bacterium]
MLEKHLVNELKAVSLSMFRKDFLGIFHGSLSAKIENNIFVINKSYSIFDELTDSDFVELYTKKDYRWNNASRDSDIHLQIYNNISEAKYICYTMPPFTTSYALTHDKIIPKDYFGSTLVGPQKVYDPGHFDTWYKRAHMEIAHHMKKENSNIMVIKGYGVYAYNRDLHDLVKQIAILENSAKLLHNCGIEKEEQNTRYYK